MTEKTLLLSKTDIAKVFEWKKITAIDIVKKAFVHHKNKETILPAKISQIFDEESQNRINCMPATLKNYKLSGMKWISVFPNNPLDGLRNVTGKIILSEIEHGFTLAIMDASYITDLRTASVGAVASSYLAMDNAKTIGFIGAGNQARKHLEMIKEIKPQINTCYVSSRRNVTIQEFIEEELKKFPEMTFINCKDEYEQAVQDADIIVTATSTQKDILKADWIKEGALYIHVGGWEDEYAVAKKATKIVCDEWESVKHRSQTLSRMYLEGILKDDDIYSDLGDIIIGNRQGRVNETEFIYFNSVGLSFVDIMFAKYVYDFCKENGIGKEFDFS